MKFFAECITPDLNVLIEKNEKTGEKNTYIEGIFAQSEVENRNKRIYPKPILEKAIGSYVKEFVQTGRSVGEMEHPEGPQINLERISHRITNLEFKGNDVYGKALILNTPMGNIAKGLIEGGVKLGVSTRGVGSVSTKNGKTYVKEDFILGAVDIVQDPSAHQAFVEGIMEGREYFMEGNQLVERTVDQIKKTIHNTPSKKMVEAQIKAFSDFLKVIKS